VEVFTTSISMFDAIHTQEGEERNDMGEYPYLAKAVFHLTLQPTGYTATNFKHTSCITKRCILSAVLEHSRHSFSPKVHRQET
jgi:hypothetical protein